jgi:hypothetical protein
LALLFGRRGEKKVRNRCFRRIHFPGLSKLVVGLGNTKDGLANDIELIDMMVPY